MGGRTLGIKGPSSSITASGTCRTRPPLTSEPTCRDWKWSRSTSGETRVFSIPAIRRLFRCQSGHREPTHRRSVVTGRFDMLGARHAIALVEQIEIVHTRCFGQIGGGAIGG